MPAVGFNGEGWALYPSFEACSDAHITLYVRAFQKDSLIFYVGPDSIRPSAIGVEGSRFIRVDYNFTNVRVVVVPRCVRIKTNLLLTIRYNHVRGYK